MADIVLRNRDGKEINYPGVNYIKVNKADGETQGYAAYDPETLVPENLVSGVVVGDVEGALEVPQAVEKTIDPDFSAGDMEVVPEDGKVFSKVSIPTPENLVPANIAEGVNIAGIVGELAAGGAKVYFGKHSTTGASGSRVNVDFGFKPDLLLVFATAIVTTTNTGAMLFGVTNEMVEKYGVSMGAGYPASIRMSSRSSTGVGYSSGIEPIDIASTVSGPICQCDETGFNIGSGKFYSGTVAVLAMKLT